MNDTTRKNSRALGAAIVLAALIPAPLLRAGVTWFGDVVPDDPTMWDASTEAYIGKDTSGTLTIIAGAEVTSGWGALGFSAGSTGEVTVDGAGSTWTNKGLDIGYFGTGTLSITGGAAVSNWVGCIGLNAGSTGEVTVDGAGSTWTSSDVLYVGLEGTGALSITGGGTVGSNFHSWVGLRSGSTGMVTVDGPGSAFCTGELRVGCHQEGGNTLTITGGGAVESSRAYIGQSGNAPDVVTVNGTGSTWTNSGGLYIGDHGGKGTLAVADGGAVNYGWGRISYYGGIGEVTVRGPGSVLTGSYELIVGHGFGSNGALTITDGGTAGNDSAYISGYMWGAMGEVTVHGAGSTWTNRGNLHIGHYDESISMLAITGGGAVSNRSGAMGVGWDSIAEVMVDGAGTTWTNSEDLTVGDDAGDGMLTITGGGAVSNRLGAIGVGDWSTGAVTVDGAGSTWTSTEDLVVGGYGFGTLSITAGGAVSNAAGYIGFGGDDYYHSTGEVTVEGAGSTWTNSGDLHVGYEGWGALTITDGGMVSVGGTLSIDTLGAAGDDSHINMADGGILAVYGDAAGSLDDFLALVGSTGPIRYWDSSIMDWADITGATYGKDYLLDYSNEGDLTGYTRLIVGAGEPGEPLLLQTVYGEQAAIHVLPESTVEFGVVYESSAGDETLTGLGLRVHWDSSVLDFAGVTELFGPGLQPIGEPQEDTADYDGDPATDRYLTLLWVDLAGAWPGEGTTPLRLFNVHFDVAAAGFESAAVNFSVSTTAAGYGFEATPVEIHEATWWLDVDDNGTCDALTDGLMIARRLAGLPPEAVVKGAVAHGALRTDPDDIAAYIDLGASIVLNVDGIPSAILDVDANGACRALTDGIMVIRHLAGLPPPAVVQGAIAPGGQRRDPWAITSYIEVFCPSAGLPVSLGAPALAASSPTDDAPSAPAPLGDRPAQIVYGSPAVQPAGPGQPVELTAVYATDTGDETLTGLGLRVHWDSTALQYQGFSGALPRGLQPVGDPQADVTDLDGDPRTDQYLTLLWLDSSGAWPGVGATPAELVSLAFVTAPGFTGPTPVRFTASATAAGYEARTYTAWVGAAVGDVNLDGVVDQADIDALHANIGSEDPLYDLNGDGTVDARDVDYLIENILGTRRGDANLDGRVDLDDFVILKTNFGAVDAGWSQGDFSGDGRVDLDDFVILKNNFGK